MGKKTYIGVNDTAKKTKKAYIGVDGTAKKIKKIYMGIDGVAKQIFGGGEIKYYGYATAFNTNKSEAIGVSFENYGAFVGGQNSYPNKIDVYNKSLTHTYMSGSNWESYNGTAININEKLVTCCGSYSGNYYNNLTVRTLSGTVEKSESWYSVGCACLGVASDKTTAMYTGGFYSTTTYAEAVSTDSSFTATTQTSLTKARSHHTGVAVGSYYLFGGGQTCSRSTWSFLNSVEGYNKNGFSKITGISDLTSSNETLLNNAVSAFGHAIFLTKDSDKKAIMDVYSPSLTKVITGRELGLWIGNYLKFGAIGEVLILLARAGSNITDKQMDSSFTITDFEPYSTNTHSNLANASVGDYLLFGSGITGDSSTSKFYTLKYPQVYVVE